MINLLSPLRTFILTSAAVTDKLSVYNDAPAIFTRRPAPAGAQYPMVFIAPAVPYSEADYLTNLHGNSLYDVSVYGSNASAAEYRDVEDCSFALVNLLHRAHPTNFALSDGWGVVQITAAGPAPAPTDDLDLVGRVIRLSIEVDKS